MNPRKKGLPAFRGDPVEQAVRGDVAAPRQEERAVGDARIQGGVVIHFKAAVETPHRIQNERADEGGSMVTLAAKFLRKGRNAAGQSRGSKVSNRVVHR